MADDKIRQDKTWTVQDARAHFGDVIDGALRGQPQRISRRGKDAVVVVSEEEWRRHVKPDKPKMNFREFLGTFPLSQEEWEEVAPRRHDRRNNPFSEV
ncbi:type II toxin-antitoxin system Phd/YefM family antitoxin [Microvirga pudoricolor]|uniref:type II toxin-antitoxin system Phd/YefM family antitoxin n=1 Tax=Microvirga pudoricolor TaxID=2778729 RepID=UPI0019524922|nr:type II toxin-antitoxin system Phd/YefM family antitoxin [Microvirga pudoricolor]MBM6594092.1 type II toxin-antitoxin system Phd/YefM family antitoxin [Microvirga pudoricolor]